VLKLKWYAVDASGTQMASTDVHTVTVRLNDDLSPTADDVICPGKVHHTLLHNESAHTVTWQVPKVVSDNCPPADGEYPHATEAYRSNLGVTDGVFPALTSTNDEHGHTIEHTGQFSPGIYEVAYDLQDANGNEYPHECKLIIEVEQYASPVHLECPEEVPVSITGKKNYAAVTWQEPNHDNGRAHQDNNPVDVSYRPEGVVPGVAFPWGETTITVVATGTGNVSDASHNTAMCSFVVNVTDERPPELFGKRFHCRKLANGATAPGAAPYRLCESSKFLEITEHPHYNDTGGYTIDHVGALPHQECCDSELGDGTIVPHQCTVESPLISYCEPNPAGR
jgi:hypothetical protein